MSIYFASYIVDLIPISSSGVSPVFEFLRAPKVYRDLFIFLKNSHIWSLDLRNLHIPGFDSLHEFALAPLQTLGCPQEFERACPLEAVAFDLSLKIRPFYVYAFSASIVLKSEPPSTSGGRDA